MKAQVLARLRDRFGAAIWPFEPLVSDIAIVEIWPSLTLGAAPDGRIRDAWQVEETARMVEHVWELRQVRFDYYFFDENCSFRLLELLEVARPSLRLTDQGLVDADAHRFVSMWVDRA